MNLQQQRAQARQECEDHKIAVLPYGNAWWLLGNGINQVVGELAGISPTQLQRFSCAHR
ncbi:MAG: hypothetical protein L6Q55_08230 [Azonexus sp.]|nr:hypothetical protein [Azonexus sp.]MCK6412392.1 hypothetical protein [Azonexus sp.]